MPCSSGASFQPVGDSVADQRIVEVRSNQIDDVGKLVARRMPTGCCFGAEVEVHGRIRPLVTGGGIVGRMMEGVKLRGGIPEFCADNCIRSGPAFYIVHLATAIDQVVARTAKDDIVRRSAEKGVIPCAAINIVPARTGLDAVRAAAGKL